MLHHCLLYSTRVMALSAARLYHDTDTFTYCLQPVTTHGAVQVTA